MNELTPEEIMADLVLERQHEEAAEEEATTRWEGPR